MAAPIPLLKGFAKTVATVKPDPRKRLTISDPDTRGLYLRVTPTGHKSWAVISRDPGGKQVWAVIGGCDKVSLEAAREAAPTAIARIKAGEGAFPKAEPKKQPATFRTVAENFVERHVKKNALRTAPETERILKVYVYPEWGSRAFEAIRRSDVSALLDKIEDGTAGEGGDMGGPVMADRTLAALSKLFNWYASRSDDYVSPVVRGMGRTKGRERARDRMLTDDEIRAMWKASGSADLGTFGAFVRVCLLTAQRRAKVAEMRWQDISDDGVWTIPAEDREKVNAGELRLSALALETIRGITPKDGNPYVFAGRGKRAIAGFSKSKAALDAKATIAPWVLHDLRRTAKSLMARAGVRPDVSERVLGHVIAGVEGVYDRYSYGAEKADALDKLAGLVALILNPPAANVVGLRRA
jgi:integrase